jgi:hypothetical protein
MACRLASAPVLPVSMLKRLQDLGGSKNNEAESSRIPLRCFYPLMKIIIFHHLD